ncbi:transposase [Micromonospora sp. NBC_00362]|uniref:transposase n=1 Tax=Micromonospora sp. NBC_00362 TaxID=2975975 RepID=UPI002254FE93|nr:transposase [Micromonospora sp. NBC_00362]MCX5122091.1 transposase [Micromonospora sp. NBC_00362]
MSALPLVAPSGSALRQARQRLGPQPVRALFDVLRGLAATSAAQTRWRGLLLAIIDGTFLTVADAPATASRYAKQRCNNGSSGYPQLRLSALLSCGTRSVIDVVFDPVSVGELNQARQLARSLRPGMLLMADRNYAGADLIATLAATGVGLLIRCKIGRKLLILRRRRDGSFGSIIGGLPIRVSDAQVSITTTDGTHTGGYRPITTHARPRQTPRR